MTLSPPLIAVIVGLILAGAVTMTIALTKTRTITGLLTHNCEDDIFSASSIQSWRYLSLLMGFFLCGYCLAVYLVVSEQSNRLSLLTGTVFFVGSLFVLFSISTYRRTLRQLIVSQSQYRQESNRATAALSQLQQVQKTQTQLIHNEKMLSLNQLSAGIAHEINNPIGFIYSNLSHISQYTQDLLSLIRAYQQTDASTKPEIANLTEDIDLEFIEPDLFKILESMETGTQRIREVVGSMKVFTRLDESRYKSARLQDDLDSTLTMLGAQIQGEPTEPEIAIVRRYREIPLVECDHSAINQVFLQLIKNSIEAFRLSEQMNDKATVFLQTCQLDQDWVRVEVSDNGPGIDEETRKHIFDPFFTTKPVGDGTGLGLSISHQIVVDHHQGKLYCRSTPGTGTSFMLELPISRPR